MLLVIVFISQKLRAELSPPLRKRSPISDFVEEFGEQIPPQKFRIEIEGLVFGFWFGCRTDGGSPVKRFSKKNNTWLFTIFTTESFFFCR